MSTTDMSARPAASSLSESVEAEGTTVREVLDEVFAALQSGVIQARGDTVCLLSGGNIEWTGLRDLLGDR